MLELELAPKPTLKLMPKPTLKLMPSHTIAVNITTTVTYTDTPTPPQFFAVVQHKTTTTPSATPFTIATVTFS